MKNHSWPVQSSFGRRCRQSVSCLCLVLFSCYRLAGLIGQSRNKTTMVWSESELRSFLTEREKWQRTSRVYREWGTCVSMRLDCSDGRPVFFPKRRPAVSLLVVVVSVWRGVIRRLRPSTFNYLPPPPLLRRSGNLSSLICQSSLVRRHCGSNATNRPIQKRPDASQVDWRDKRNQFWPVDNISKLKQKRKETFFHLSWFASTMFLLLFWNNTYVSTLFFRFR